MDNINSSSGFKGKRDYRESKIVETDKFANISNKKPLNFLHHLNKSLYKKNKLPSYFIYFPTRIGLHIG